MRKPLHIKDARIKYDIIRAELEAVGIGDFDEFDDTFIFTSVPYDNNFFYEGRDGLVIFSFSDWHQLTNIPVANGVVYLLLQCIIKYRLKIGENHNKNVGCINDFWWDKTGIDVGMRAAFICADCRQHSRENLVKLASEVSEITAMLDILSAASRRELDVLQMTYVEGYQETKGCAQQFDVFLCHNNADKAEVRALNYVLKAAGIRTWFDEEQLSPGDSWQGNLEAAIPNIRACMVIVGGSGLGPWQEIERRAFIGEFANRGCKVVPVLIGSAVNPPELPLFLRQFMWSDMRETEKREREVKRLIAALIP